MIKLYASFKMRGKVYNRFPTLNEWINIERDINDVINDIINYYEEE